MSYKYLRWVEVGMFVAGLIMWGVSVESGRAWMTTLGVASMGLALMLSGFMAMATGELTMWRGRYGVTRDRGLSARLFGLALSLIGGALLALAAGRLMGLDDGLAAFLRDRPGFAMVPIGLLLLTIGAANLVGAWNRRGSMIGVFQSIKNWIAGLLFVVLGLGLVGVGLYEVAAPQAFDDLLSSFFQPIGLSDTDL